MPAAVADSAESGGPPPAAGGSPAQPAHDAPHSVPPALSAFVGRRREVEELGATLAQVRLLTLTGVGGVGKTRLARELAAAAAAGGRYPHGVWWIELAPLAAGADVLQVAAALGARPGPGTSPADVLDLVAGALRGGPGDRRSTLLVLDNCEHVVDAVAGLAEHLLRAAPGLTILATSREALGVEGETARQVAPLSHPPAARAGGDAVTAAAVSAYDAALLFAERARAAQAGFALTDRTAPAVAAVCARLDGLPLALELAAAALPALGLAALAERLGDALAVLTRGRRTALPRHRTLRAVLDWSYALLAPEERRLLEALSVVRGAVPLGVVERVGAGGGAGDGGDGRGVTGPLARLVAHSLVETRDRDGETWYRLLEPVRQYAAARLAADPARAAAVHARHAGWIATLAGEAELALWSPARARTVARLQRDIDDIRAALAWAAGPGGDPALALRIAGALTYFWLTGGPWRDGARWLEAAVAAAARTGTGEAGRPPEERLALAGAEHPVALLSWYAGRFDEALALGARALGRVADLTGDLPGDRPSDPLGDREPAAGAPAAAADAAGPAAGADAELRRRALMLATQLRALETHAAAMLGDRARSEASMRAGLAAALASGDSYTVAASLLRAGMVHLETGEHARAEAAYADAERRLRALGDRWLLSLCYEGLAELALARGDAAGAAARARASVDLLRPEPDAWFVSRALDTLAAAGALTLADAPAPAADAEARAAGAAARVLGAASALRATIGAGLSGFDRSRQEAAVAGARRALGAAAFDAAWADGARTTLADAFALAATAPVLVGGDGATLGRPAGGAPDAGRPAAPPGADVPVSLRATVLGQFRVTRVAGGHEEPAPWAKSKARELFLFLAVHPQGATRAQIGRALWPEASGAQLSNAFHVVLHHLRRALGGREWVALDGARYRLARAAGGALLDCDLDAVLAAAERLRRARARREAPDDGELRALRASLDRRAGPLADGLALGDWLVAHEDRIAAAWADAMLDLAALHAARGAPADLRAAVGAYEAVLARDPLREDVWRELMRCDARLGEPTRAVARFEALAVLLRRELGAAPAGDTTALADGIRRGAAAGGPLDARAVAAGRRPAGR